MITPYIFNLIKNIAIPEVDFDGGYLKNLKLNIPCPDVKNVAIKFDHANNGADLKASQVVATADGDFHYKYLFITVDGQVHVDIKNLGVDVDVDTLTQPGTPSSELAPKLKVENLAINVDPKDIDITLTGSGLIGKIANALIPLLKSSVIPQVISQATTTAKTLVDTTVNQDLALYGTQEVIPFLAGVTADYAQVGGPQFTESSIFQMGVNGTFFDAKHAKMPASPPATFALHDPKGKTAQIFATEYTVNSALDSGFTTGNTLDVTYLLSHFLNLTVTTDDFGKLIPAVLTKYGSGVPVEFAGKFIKAPSHTTMDSTGQSVTGSLEITCTINKEVAIQASFEDADAQATISSTNGKIFGNIGKATIGTLGSGFVTTLGMTGPELMTLL